MGSEMCIRDSVEIESRPLWKPMHRQPVYSNAEAEIDGTSEALFDRGLCLPSSSVLSVDEVDEVISHIRSAIT